MQYDEAKATTPGAAIAANATASRPARTASSRVHQQQVVTWSVPGHCGPQKGEAISGLQRRSHGFIEQELSSVKDHRYILAGMTRCDTESWLRKRCSDLQNGELTQCHAGAKKRPNQSCGSQKAEARLKQTVGRRCD